MPRRLTHEHLPSVLLDRIVARDAALWVDTPQGLASFDALARFIALPWRSVFCESTDARLREALTKFGPDKQMEAARGLLYVVARDPVNLAIPSHSLGVYFLNGLEGVDGEDSSALGRISRNRRRMNMLQQLDRAPSDLIVLSWGTPSVIEDLAALVEEGLESRIHICAQTQLESDAIPFDYTEITSDLRSLVDVAREYLRGALPSGDLLVRTRRADGKYQLVDLSPAVDVDRPIGTYFHLLLSSDIGVATETDLTSDDITKFFSGGEVVWKHFAAGLPWPREREALDTVLRLLGRAEFEQTNNVEILYVVSQPGAGATTFLRTVAFAAARAGFPALVAKPGIGRPQFGDIRTFLLEAALLFSDPTQEVRTPEPAWLLVFDVEHFTDHEGELEEYARELQRSGRPIVVLLASPEPVRQALRTNSRARKIGELTHDVSHEDAIMLGRHLGRFLDPHGKARSESEWDIFWQASSQGDVMYSGSFWLSLEFWLKREFDLSESIQSWLSRQLQTANVPTVVKLALLRVAALAVALTPSPTFVIRGSGSNIVPRVVEAMRAVVEQIPAIGLTERDVEMRRMWTISHSQLARYILLAASRDTSFRTQLGLDSDDPLLLRLRLLEEILRDPEISRTENRWLVEAFAIRILKLDSGALGEEFFQHWRNVAQVLTEQLHLVKTSRTYVHHVAISCRRIGQMGSEYGADQDERVFMFEKARELLEYALDKMPIQANDETDLNLYNTLARTYNDLAELEQVRGQPRARIADLREKASAAAAAAERLGSGNPYVLETLAKTLLVEGAQAGSRDRQVENAARALGYVVRAMHLDSAEERITALSKLANSALDVLLADDSRAIIERLVEANNPLGFVARAWLELYPEAGDARWDLNIADVEPERLQRANDVLRGCHDLANPVLLELLYKITVTLNPTDFTEQLALLEGLQGRTQRLPLQLDYERAVLLHQVGRHDDANREFQRIRVELKEGRGFVRVPERLTWLVGTGSRRRRVNATIKEFQAFRGFAAVPGLGSRSSVPFRPDEFGGARLRVGQQLQCEVSFGPNGPLLRPILGG